MKRAKSYIYLLLIFLIISLILPISYANCTNDDCDNADYKTDLNNGGNGICDLKKNYYQKGTTYNNEAPSGSKLKNDECVDVDTVREYYLDCCGWTCNDVTRYIDHDCPNNYFCSDGACITCKSDGQTCSSPSSSTVECCNGICNANGKCSSCLDECTTDGATRCTSSGSQQTCGNYDSDSCLEWGADVSCICAGGSCVECVQNSQCNSDGWYCDSGNYREYRDYSCSSYNCVHSDSNRFDCDDLDGYYCNSDGDSEYRQYSCTGSGSCTYGITSGQSCAWGCSGGTCDSYCDTDRCGDGTCNCGETLSSCNQDCCKSDGSTCSSPGSSTTECCSGTCALDGKCASPVCYSDSDCPADTWQNNPFCQDGDVWDGVNDNFCSNGGNSNAACSGQSTSRLREDCGDYGCTSGACNTCKADGQTCSTSFSSTAECCSGTCAADGKCGAPVCFSDSDCPADEWTNTTFCQNGDVWDGVNDNFCVNGGNSTAACSGQSTTRLKEDCAGLGCNNGACNTCKADGTTCLTPGTSTQECCGGLCDSSGVCRSCLDECSTSGDTRCLDSNSQETCGDYDSDSCLEWGGGMSCPYGCSNNECFDCSLDFCSSSSAACCAREDVCQDDGVCNLNCASGDYDDPDCPTPCTGLPDGSDEYCQCKSDLDCKGYDGDTYCEFSNKPYPGCKDISYEDKCSNIDDLSCESNVLYRCEQVGKILDWVKVTSCTNSQVCSVSESSCITLGNYDLIIDDAPPSVIVNKQPYTILKVNIKIDGYVDPSLDLGYDHDVFDPVSGSCSNLQQGDNICYFEIDSLVGESYAFEFGKDSQNINIIGNDAYIAYLTDSVQLRRRYDDDNAVDLMLTKLYEEAAANDGVVYDLSVQFRYLDGYTYNHPFDYAFSRYSEDRLIPEHTDNTYADQVAAFIQDKLSFARNIVIVGDDYVIPHRRDIYTISEGSVAPWLRPFYKGVKERLLPYLSSMITTPVPIWNPGLGELNYQFSDKSSSFADTYVANVYTDQQLISRDVPYDYSDLDQVFRDDDVVRSNDVKIVLPTTVSPQMRSAITNMKNQLVSEGLVGKLSDFTEMDGSSLNCNDFSKFSDAWFFDPLDVPIVIGTPETNPALSCYPVYSTEGMEDIISIEPSVWNKNGAAIIMNTNDTDVVNDFSNVVIADKVYEDLHGRTYMYVHDGITVVSLALIPLSFGASAFGSVALETTVLVVDLSVSAIDASDTCAYRYGELPNSAGRWIECGASAAPLVAFGGGKLISKLRVGDLYKAAELADETGDLRRVANKFVSSSGEADYILSKIPKSNYDDFLRILERGMDNEAEDIGSKYAQKLIHVLKRSNIPKSAFTNDDELLNLIGDAVATHIDSSDEVLDAIAKIAGRGDENALDILDILSKSKNSWNKAELTELESFDEYTLNLILEAQRIGLYSDNSRLLSLGYVHSINFLDIDPVKLTDFEWFIEGRTLSGIGKMKSVNGENIFIKPSRLEIHFDDLGNPYIFEKTGPTKLDIIRERNSYIIHSTVLDNWDDVKIPKTRIVDNIVIDGYEDSALLIEDGFKDGGQEIQKIIPENIVDGAKVFRETDKITEQQKQVLRGKYFMDLVFGNLDSNSRNIGIDSSGKVVFFDLESAFHDYSDFYKVSGNKLDALLSDPDWIFNSLANEGSMPYFKDVHLLWTSNDPVKRKIVLDAFEPYVESLDRLNKNGQLRKIFRDTSIFNGVSDSDIENFKIMENAIFGGKSSKGRLKTFIDDFYELKNEVG